MKSLVSCIICTYNRAHLLKFAVESVLEQTYPNWELLIVDDNSTDHTAEAIRQFQATDPRVRYLKNPKKGLPSARNFGIRSARGDLIAFLDDDDLCLPHRFESQASAMNASGAGFLVSGFQTKNIETGELTGQCKLELKAAAAGFPSRWMVKKSLLEKIGGFDEDFTCLEDVECSLRLARHEVFALHDDIVLTYHVNPGSMSRNHEDLIKGILKLLKKHGSFLHPIEAAWWHYVAGINYYKLDDKEKARAQFEKAAQLDSRGIYNWGYWFFRNTPFRNGAFKRINLKVLNMLEPYKFPTLVHHRIV